NILRPGEVVPNAVQAFLHASGAITDRVMAAMDAADGSGGDSRCTCPPWPNDGSKPKIPCDGKTAQVAYILMAERTDTNGDSHNNGKYTMYLTVSQPAENHGANIIKDGENLNPVKTLPSAAWADEGQIPIRHSQAGGEISPPLTWTNVPEGIASFALIAHDLDAATGTGTDDMLHWLLWNIPADARSLPEGVPQGAQ